MLEGNEKLYRHSSIKWFGGVKIIWLLSNSAGGKAQLSTNMSVKAVALLNGRLTRGTPFKVASHVIPGGEGTVKLL